MRVVTGDEMTALDREAIRGYGLPAAALMERAGTAVADRVAALVGRDRFADARIHIVCGGGNNGADGFVVARNCVNWGARVRVFLVHGSREPGRESAAFLRVLEKMGVPISTVSEQEEKKLGLTLRTADVIVDAISGTGVKGALRPHVLRWVQIVNEAKRPVVSVDLPTGVSADTGAVHTEAVRATETVTFGLPKVGHLVDPGRQFTGKLTVADIGFPVGLTQGEGAARIWMRRVEAAKLLKRRPEDGHKGTFGRVVAVAGSLGMAGAAALVLRGALRTGAGLALFAGPRDLIEIIQRLVPEATCLALPGDGDRLTPSGARAVLDHLKEGDVLAVGPGLGTGSSVAEGVVALVKEARVPLVVDADALNALAAQGAAFGGTLRRESPRVMTPHPKEASRLLGWETERVVSDRFGALEALGKGWNSTILLKGSPTLTLGTDGPVAINGSGDVSLATGGTGDVLTGIIAALLAEGHTPWQAAALGAYVHGSAGELAGRVRGRRSVVASDVVETLGEAYLELERSEVNGRVGPEG